MPTPELLQTSAARVHPIRVGYFFSPLEVTMNDDVLEVLRQLKNGKMPRVDDLRSQGYSDDTIDSVKAHIDVKEIISLDLRSGKQVIRLAVPKQV